MKLWTVAVLGLLGGVVLLAIFRFTIVSPEDPVHYHANFAVVVDGERVDLSGDEYMEEVGTCKVSERVLPTERAHLHNNNHDVAHVHHEGVTWGHLLTNLGFGLGKEYLALDDGHVLTEGGGRSLKFILNGQPQFALYNELIRSGDRLLISYGPETEEEVLRTQFPQVGSTAEDYNERPDPAGCAGPADVTLWDRIRHAFVG